MSVGMEDPAVDLVAFETQPYPEELRSSLMELAFGEQCTAEELATLHTAVAVSFSNAFFAVCRKGKVVGRERWISSVLTVRRWRTSRRRPGSRRRSPGRSSSDLRG